LWSRSKMGKYESIQGLERCSPDRFNASLSHGWCILFHLNMDSDSLRTGTFIICIMMHCDMWTWIRVLQYAGSDKSALWWTNSNMRLFANIRPLLVLDWCCRLSVGMVTVSWLTPSPRLLPHCCICVVEGNCFVTRV
jgi:hypothetical protein